MNRERSIVNRHLSCSRSKHCLSPRAWNPLRPETLLYASSTMSATSTTSANVTPVRRLSLSTSPLMRPGI